MRCLFFERQVKRTRALRGQNAEFCMSKHAAKISNWSRTTSSLDPTARHYGTGI